MVVWFLEVLIIFFDEMGVGQQYFGWVVYVEGEVFVVFYEGWGLDYEQCVVIQGFGWMQEGVYVSEVVGVDEIQVLVEGFGFGCIGYEIYYV